MGADLGGGAYLGMVWEEILVGAYLGMVWEEILVGSLPGYGVGGDLGGEPTWVWCGWRSW